MMNQTSKDVPMYSRLIANWDTSSVRKEKLHGRSYFVLNMVAGKEGVLEGSDGAGFYPGPEWSKSADFWNHKPIVVSHPVRTDDDGNEVPVTAADAEVLGNQQVGFILGSNYDDGLKQEAWLDEELTKKVADGGVHTAIQNKKALEVSTGLYAVKDPTSGEWNGTPYDFVARDHQPNHVAILLNDKGACSIEAGCGLLVNCGCKAGKVKAGSAGPIINALSYLDINYSVSSALNTKFTAASAPGYTWNGYMVDVYPDFVVYRCDGKYFQIGYAIKDDKVTITGDPKEVTPVVEYRLVTNKAYVGTTDGDFISNQEKAMTAKFVKKEKIDQLISNGRYQEKDRVDLEKVPDNILEGMNSEKAKDETKKEEPAPVIVNSSIKEVSEEEWLADPRTPKAVKAVHLRNKQRDTAQAEALVKRITANSLNKFQESWLKSQNLDVLEGLAAMSPPLEDPTPSADGQAGGVLQPGFSGTNYGISAPSPIANSAPTTITPLTRLPWDDK